MKGTISHRKVEILREQPEQFETIRGAHLPELSRKADGKFRHQQLVKCIRLLVEVEGVVEVRGVWLGLSPERLDLAEVAEVEDLGVEPGGTHQRGYTFPRRANRLEEKAQVVAPLLEGS